MIYRKNRFSPQNKTSASLKLLTTASALALVGCGGGTGGGAFFVPGSGSGGGAAPGGGGSAIGGGNDTGDSGVVILRYPTSGATISVGAGLTSTSTTHGSDTIVTFTAGTGNVSFG